MAFTLVISAEGESTMQFYTDIRLDCPLKGQSIMTLWQN